MRATKVLLACLVLTLLAAVLIKCTRHPTEPKLTVEIGQPAPPFKLRNLTGGEISLDQYKGKVVMLDFWATWCGPCRMMIPMLENLQKEHPNKFTLLAINLQEPDDVVRDYVRQANMQSEVLLDENGSVGETYGTEAIPLLVLIDRNGIVRQIQNGFSPSMSGRLGATIEELQN